MYAELKNKIETYRKLGMSEINGAKGNVYIYILYKWHYHKEIHNTSEITHKITQKVVHTRQNIRCRSHFSVDSCTKLPYCNVGSLKFWQSYVLFFSNPFRMYKIFRLNTISKFGLYHWKEKSFDWKWLFYLRKKNGFWKYIICSGSDPIHKMSCNTSREEKIFYVKG